MIVCDRCGKSFQAKPNEDGSINGYGIFIGDFSEPVANVCALCYAELKMMEPEQVYEFLNGVIDQ